MTYRERNLKIAGELLLIRGDVPKEMRGRFSALVQLIAECHPFMTSAHFQHCPICENKPGSPALCPSCLHNRDLISLLTETLRGRLPDRVTVDLSIDEARALVDVTAAAMDDRGRVSKKWFRVPKIRRIAQSACDRLWKAWQSQDKHSYKNL